MQCEYECSYKINAEINLSVCFQQDTDNTDEIIRRCIYYHFIAFKPTSFKSILIFVLALIKMLCKYFLNLHILVHDSE